MNKAQPALLVLLTAMDLRDSSGRGWTVPSGNRVQNENVLTFGFVLAAEEALCEALVGDGGALLPSSDW